MADTITDTRTLIHAGNAVTPYDSLAGTAAGTLDTEVSISGGSSVGISLGSALVGLLHDAGAVVTAYANSVFYMRINCGIVGLLDTKTNGGFRMRFCGNTVTDFFEVYVGGNDSWPRAIAGGWCTFVVDIELARSTAVTNGWTGGTAPATNAVRYVGFCGITGGTMPRMVDNTWINGLYYLPDGNAGITIQGRSGGTTPWNFSDIFTQLGNAAGVFTPAGAGGAFVCNTPISIGAYDATVHAFTATNAIILWADQEYAPADLYGIKLVGANTGTINVNLGVKSGTGDAATGAQGCVIASGSDQVRWKLNADDGFNSIDAFGMYGCTFIHGGALSIYNDNVESISCVYIDCSNIEIGPQTFGSTANAFQRCKVIQSNGAAVGYFVNTKDMTNIRFCDFSFSSGHAIKLSGGPDVTQESRGNKFTGAFVGTPGSNPTENSGSTDAAIYNDQTSLIPGVTISVTNGGDTPSVRNGTLSRTTVVNNINVTLTGMKDNSEVRVYDNAALASRVELAGIENATTGTTDDRSFTFSLGAAVVTNIVVFALGYEPVYLNGFTIPASNASIPISQKVDRTYTNPA